MDPGPPVGSRRGGRRWGVRGSGGVTWQTARFPSSAGRSGSTWRAPTRPRRARSTRGSSAGRSRSTRTRSTAATRSRGSTAGTSPGSGGTQAPGAPTAWSIYIGTADADGLAEKVAAAGGTVVVPPFAVGDQGRMAVFQDPTGAFISRLAAGRDGRLRDRRAEHVPLGRAERARHGPGDRLLRRRLRLGRPGVADARRARRTSMFQLAEERCRGRDGDEPDGPRRGPQLLDGLLRRGRRRRLVPDGARGRRPRDDGRRTPFPGGRFAIVGDPQGAVFGLHMLSRGQA